MKKRDKGSRLEGVEVRAVHGKARLAHVRYLMGYRQINTSVVGGTTQRHQPPSQPGPGAKDVGLFQSDSVSPLDELGFGGAL